MEHYFLVMQLVKILHFTVKDVDQINKCAHIAMKNIQYTYNSSINTQATLIDFKTISCRKLDAPSAILFR